MSNTPSRFSRVVTHVRDLMFLATLIAGLTTAASGVAFQFVWPYLVAQLKEDLDVATRADLAAIQEKLDSATGDDRIIRMPAGHSYVSEPVAKGEPILLNLVIARTQKGKDCTFSSGTPIFRDQRDIPFAAGNIAPIKQLALSAERMLVTLDVPAAIAAGRVSVTLNLKYSCPFGPSGINIDVYEETDTIFFQLDPAN